MDTQQLAARIAAINGESLGDTLDRHGWAVLPRLIDRDSARATADLFDHDDRFRSRIVMARHGFGRGEYGYFAHPLPPLVTQLREGIYPLLTATANRWHARLDDPVRFPDSHPAYIARCHAAGQERPTPLLLRYRAGDYNCLHQDIYGEHAFPLQVAILLSAPESDFTGGDFVLTEQRPRMQSRAEIVPLGQGDAVIFAVRHRPVRGNRGDYRVTMRHGVGTIRSGERHTLGIIFHDAS